MTGYDCYRKALALLGYTGSDGLSSGENYFLRRAGDVFSQIGMDLGLSVKSLSDSFEADSMIEEAFPYGMAMLLALEEEDGGKMQLFSQIYNAKRATAKATVQKITDSHLFGGESS